MNRKATAAVLGAGSLWGIISIFVRQLNAMGADGPSVGQGPGSDQRREFCFLWLGLAHRELLKIRLQDLWYFIGTGIISLALFNWCYFTTIELSQASIAVVLLIPPPIFIMVLSAIFFRERINRRKVMALVMTFLGCVLVAGLLGGTYTPDPKVLLLGLGSGLFYGLYSIFRLRGPAAVRYPSR